MSDQVTICNVALSRAGHDSRISSFDEKSPAAAECRLKFDFAAEAMLRDYDWSFARVSERLALMSEAPVLSAKWKYVYAGPPRAAAIRALLPEGGAVVPGMKPIAFELGMAVGSDDQERTVIYTNEPNAVCVYTRIVLNVGLFDPLFASALAWRMGIELALKFTSDNDTFKKCVDGYARELSAAWTAAANEGTDSLTIESGSILARA